MKKAVALEHQNREILEPRGDIPIEFSVID